MKFKTNDVALAILFKTFNYPYVGATSSIKYNGQPVVTFEFDVPNESTVKNITRDYYNHTLEVDAYDHDEAAKFIRKEIFAHKPTKNTDVPVL